jgi:hypothetical protein
MRSPGAAATASEAEKNKTVSASAANTNKTSIKAVQEQSGHQVPERFFTVTDGRLTAGYIKQVGKVYSALAYDRRRLGTFDSLKAASDAVCAAQGGVR